MGKRGRKPRDPDVAPDVEQAQQDGRQRRVYLLGHSWVVSLPRWARDRLACLEGGPIYLHDEGRDEVVLSALPVRPGGRPSGLKLREDLARARRLITELQTQRQVSREAVWNEFRTHEALRLVRLQLTGYPAIDAINDRLARLEDRLGTRPGPRWPGRRRRSVRAETAPGPDSYPGPSARPDPSAQVHEEGASPARPTPDPPPPPCRVCGEAWAAHPKPDHAWDTPPVGIEERGVGAERPLSGQP